MLMWDMLFIIIIINKINGQHLITWKYILFVVLISLLTCFDLLLCLQQLSHNQTSFSLTLTSPSNLMCPHSYHLLCYCYWHVIIVYSSTLDMVQFENAIYISISITWMMFATLTFCVKTKFYKISVFYYIMPFNAEFFCFLSCVCKFKKILSNDLTY